MREQPSVSQDMEAESTHKRLFAHQQKDQDTVELSVRGSSLWLEKRVGQSKKVEAGGPWRGRNIMGSVPLMSQRTGCCPGLPSLQHINMTGGHHRLPSCLHSLRTSVCLTEHLTAGGGGAEKWG